MKHLSIKSVVAQSAANKEKLFNKQYVYHHGLLPGGELRVLVHGRHHPFHRGYATGLMHGVVSDSLIGRDR